MRIIDKAANTREVLLFIMERNHGIKRPQPRLDDDAVKSKHKKNSIRGKGKKTQTNEVVADLLGKYLGSSWWQALV